MDETIGQPAEYLEFFRLFNQRKFFEAHEVLEELWVIEAGPLRDYYKGLIMASAAICLWRRGTPAGARRLHVLSQAYLSAYPDFFEGFALREFREAMAALFRPLAEATAEATPTLDCGQIPVLSVTGNR
ncbi:DUF309 domain-containing protein [Candidatus Poribacteria bacterium]|nr:DUF309 domain-containing protein [Candidatus Poribacteria bacterium]